jgi:hypothetical protein
MQTALAKRLARTYSNHKERNTMSKLMIAVFVAAGLSYAGAGVAQMASPTTYPTPMSKASYDQATKDASAQYKIEKDACSSFKGNANDICVAEAKGKRNVARAEAASAYKHTPKAREYARIAYAKATYGVAIERCDDLAGNPKDVCVKEAKAELINGKANAKVDRVTADTRQEAAATQAVARKEANADKRDAEYKVATEKCESLAGASKDTCVNNAKMQYGKS